ncbi:MAG TPA: hypothetical protein VKZ69_03630 [Limnochordales bacterium]|nr:hypothetical protein [Limnochordales bacterium]
MLLTIAAILSVVLLFGGVIGLLNPRWVKMDNRKQAVAAVIIGLVLMVFAAPDNDQQSRSGAASTATDQPRTYGELSIDDVSVSNGQIVVSGATDLPNGAELLVSLQKDEEPRFLAQAKALVSEGRYSATFTHPDRPDLARATFDVSVSFHPRSQPDAIKATVGENGEQLAGSLVQDGLIGRYLTLSRQETLEIPVRTEYTFLSPDEFRTGSPEHVLASFLAAWKAHDFQTMTQLVLNSWRQREEDPSGLLAAWYEFKHPFEARDMKVISATDIRADLEVVVSYVSEARGAPTTVRLTALLFKEDASGSPHPAGRWLISPLAIREHEI